MSAMELDRHRRRLDRLTVTVVEVDDDVAASIRHLAKDAYRDSETARAKLVEARLALANAAVLMEQALAELSEPTHLRLVS